MKLSELSDEKLNEMCCKALGWLPVQHFMFYDRESMPGWEVLEPYGIPTWKTLDGSKKRIEPVTPSFCTSLDTVQRYLIPHLRSKDTGDFEGPEDRYVKSLLKSTQGHGAGVMHDPLFQAMNAPARARVIAFLEALGVEA